MKGHIRACSAIMPVLLAMILFLVSVSVACEGETETTPTSAPAPSPTPTAMPQATVTPLPPVITITSPPDQGEVGSNEITVNVDVDNFEIVDRLGEESVPGEGHIHFYKDVTPPTASGEPAVPDEGDYQATTETSYTWTGVEPGTHTFAVQLVNNDHTPLSPPVTDKVTVTVEAGYLETGAQALAEDLVRNSPTFEFDGIEDSLELVETLYPDITNLNIQAAWQFVFEFNSRHAGYGDRTGQVLAQVITPHQAIVTVHENEVVTAILDGKWDMLNQEMLGEKADEALGTLQVRVTDAPNPDITSVDVTVKDVRVHHAGSGEWRTVVQGPETFDLVALTGVEGILGSGPLDPGRYTQVRLSVESVAVVRDGETLEAGVPSDEIKLVGTFVIEAGETTIISLDFDVEDSLVDRGPETMIFKPVVRLGVLEPGEAGGPTVALTGAEPDAAIRIVTPEDGQSVESGDVLVEVVIEGFDLVDRLGAEPAAGQGHIHYYMDVAPPTVPGVPAGPEDGDTTVSTETSYVWSNVEPGQHTFAAQLVNNDNTPLEPPVMDHVTVRATAPYLEEESRDIAREFVENSPTFEFDGIEESLELVETLYPDILYAWQFVFRFESRHAGYGDRTGQVLAQVITPHRSIITVEEGEVVSAVLDGKWDMMNQEMLDSAPAIRIAETGVSGDEIEIRVQVSNFDLVENMGEDPVPGEGHLHYYLDVEAPTAPGEPAVTEKDTFAVTTDKTYTWSGVETGEHTVSVQLVNNDHTPLDPPVIDTAEVTIESNRYSLVEGWYKGREVRYYDFGTRSPLVDGEVLTAPIYAFVYGMNGDGSPDFVPDQHNVVDVAPGEEGYSDLWRVNLVTVPADYEANSVKSVGEIMGNEYPVTPTENLVNCPVVPANSVLEVQDGLVKGWYDGEPIYYFDFGSNPVTTAPIYVFITGMNDQGNPQFVEDQRNVIDVAPFDEGYSAFWRVNFVTVSGDYTANSFTSLDDILDNDLPITRTDIVVNCPVVEVAEPVEPIVVDLVVDNLAFDRESITVTAGATVMLNFNNREEIPHNFAVYETELAENAIFQGSVITGPQTVTYEFTAPSDPGTYFFRCDIHPATMRGEFIAE